MRRVTVKLLTILLLVAGITSNNLYLQAGHDIETQTEPLQAGLLHDAIYNGSIEYVRALLQGGIDVNDRDEGGQTALHRAVFYNKVNLVKLLLTYGAKVDIEDFREYSPLHMAQEYNRKDIITIMCHNYDQNGNTPLHNAVACCNEKMIKLLRALGANQHLINNAGQTPIDLAHENGMLHYFFFAPSPLRS